MASAPKSDFQRIKNVIDEMAQNPFAGDLQKLGGKKIAWRRRIGAYRIIFELSAAQHSLFITDIQRRASNTY